MLPSAIMKTWQTWRDRYNVHARTLGFRIWFFDEGLNTWSFGFGDGEQRALRATGPARRPFASRRVRPATTRWPAIGRATAATVWRARRFCAATPVTSASSDDPPLRFKSTFVDLDNRMCGFNFGLCRGSMRPPRFGHVPCLVKISKAFLQFHLFFLSFTVPKTRSSCPHLECPMEIMSIHKKWVEKIV